MTESIHWYNPSMEDTNYFIFLVVILVVTSVQCQGGCLTLWGRLTSATESLDLPIITFNPVVEHPNSFSSVSILCSLSFGCLNHLIPICFHPKKNYHQLNRPMVIIYVINLCLSSSCSCTINIHHLFLE